VVEFEFASVEIAEIEVTPSGSKAKAEAVLETMPVLRSPDCNVYSAVKVTDWLGASVVAPGTAIGAVIPNRGSVYIIVFKSIKLVFLISNEYTITSSKSGQPSVSKRSSKTPVLTRLIEPTKQVGLTPGIVVRSYDPETIPLEASLTGDDP
jgi:hypothetical protein